MDWLEFSAAVVQSVFSWPVAILLIVIILRKSLSKVLSDLTSGMSEFTVEALGQKLRVSRQIEEIKTAADSAGLPEVTVAEAPATTSSNGEPERSSRIAAAPLSVKWIQNLIAVSPEAAILLLWAEVEGQIMAIAEKHRLRPVSTNLGGRTVWSQIRELEASGLLDAELVGILLQMRTVRNSVAHTRKTAVAPRDAEEYFGLALRVLEALEALDGAAENS